jgi:protein-disulfide isomerase
VQDSLGLLTPETCATALERRAFTEAQLNKRKQQCGTFSDKVCADLPEEQRFCKLMRDRVALETPDVCNRMLQNYQDTLVQLKQQLAESRLPPDVAAKLYEGDPPAFGPKDGSIQVVEFIDYESLYSPQTAAIVRNLSTKYSSQLRFVMRQFPIVGSPHAYEVAQAMLAANAQGKYWPMHDKVLENRERLERADLLRYARELGMNDSLLQTALEQKRYAAAVDADIALAKALKVVGMPTVFVNNERMPNAVDEASITAAIEEHLARLR